MFDFKDQVVIVTGSGSKRGIGRGIANICSLRRARKSLSPT